MEQEGTPLVLCGIAHPHYMMDYVLAHYPHAQLMAFEDHHRYTEQDIDAIVEKSKPFDFVLTTEKDIQRLRTTSLVERLAAMNKRLIALPISIRFYTPQAAFDRQILQYVAENNRKNTH
jgi:tetraacyldisaccharide 4'-kinase